MESIGIQTDDVDGKQNSLSPKLKKRKNPEPQAAQSKCQIYCSWVSDPDSVPEDSDDCLWSKMDGSKYESNNDIEADTTPVEDKTKPQKQPKYIAFHNQLLMLVLVCLVCLF